jgi:hypothetical protein
VARAQIQADIFHDRQTVVVKQKDKSSFFAALMGTQGRSPSKAAKVGSKISRKNCVNKKTSIPAGDSSKTEINMEGCKPIKHGRK